MKPLRPMERAFVDKAYENADLIYENARLARLLHDWLQYTGLRERVRNADEETGEYESGRDLIERTDAALARFSFSEDAV